MGTRYVCTIEYEPSVECEQTVFHQVPTMIVRMLERGHAEIYYMWRETIIGGKEDKKFQVVSILPLRVSKHASNSPLPRWISTNDLGTLEHWNIRTLEPPLSRLWGC